MDSKRRHARRRAREGVDTNGAPLARGEAGVGGKARRDHFGYPTRRAYRDAKDGAGYDRFRTGLSYETVRMMLWSGDADSSTWRYKRRHTVLGMWREIKSQLWQQYLEATKDNANGE